MQDNPPSFTSFMARRLISLYPFTAFFMEFLDLVNAGGSRITTSNFSPFSSSSGSSSKTSSQINFTLSDKPFNVALVCCLIYCQAEMHPHRVTLAAPAIPAFSAKEPVCVKQSRTFAPLQSLLNCQPVIFLIQEKSCFLSVFYINYHILRHFLQSAQVLVNSGPR